MIPRPHTQTHKDTNANKKAALVFQFVFEYIGMTDESTIRTRSRFLVYKNILGLTQGFVNLRWANPS